MKSRGFTAGFTLLEMVIVMVLMGVTAVFGTRFIADMASTQVGTVERAHALSGARFAMERMRRELSRAYSPSVYISADKKCVFFVPANAAGTYYGQVKNSSAQFLLPISVLGKPLLDSNLAVAASSGVANWGNYPNTLPEFNVVKFNDITNPVSSGVIEGSTNIPGIAFAEAVEAEPGSFDYETTRQRYTLLTRSQISYCLVGENLMRQEKIVGETLASVLMLSGVKSNTLFPNYNGTLQLLTVNLTLRTREGPLVLPSQLQVNYEP